MSEEHTPDSAVVPSIKPDWRPLRLPVRGSRLAWIILAAILFATVLAAVYGRDGRRSFAVEVTTGRASVIFDGSERAVWRLERAILCARLPRGEAPPEVAESHPLCAPGLYEIREGRSMEFRWTAGQTVAIEVDGEMLVVTLGHVPSSQPIPDLSVGDDGRALGPGSRILIDRSGRATSWPLPISGEIVLGSVPAAGVGGILLEGRYVVRETLPWRDMPITVSEGVLFAGDRLSFVSGSDRSSRQAQPAYGFVAEASTETPTFRMVAYSALGPSRMRIDRFGNEAGFVSPAWTEKAVRDPVLAAVTVLLSLLALLGGIGRNLYNFLSRRDHPQSIADRESESPDARTSKADASS